MAFKRKPDKPKRKYQAPSVTDVSQPKQTSTIERPKTMAAVPLIFSGVFYPKGKSADDKPMAGTFIGNAVITGLGIGGGPIEPPPDIQPEPPLVIWGGPIDPYPDIGFPIPQPPIDPPSTVTPPHEGWNWSAAKSGWYYLYIPGPDKPGPKK